MTIRKFPTSAFARSRGNSAMWVGRFPTRRRMRWVVARRREGDQVGMER